jgi:hypothetical protein
MRNPILCWLMLCLTLGAASRVQAAQDEDEHDYDGRTLSSWIASLEEEKGSGVFFDP